MSRVHTKKSRHGKDRAMRRHILRAATVALLTLAGTASIGLAAPAATPTTAAPSPTLHVDARPYGYTIHAPGGDHFVSLGLKLHITGRDFHPGSKVALAVVNTIGWKFLARGETYADVDVVARSCPWGHSMCWTANPRAGMIDYRIRLDNPPAASNLQVLYRSASTQGTETVTVR